MATRHTEHFRLLLLCCMPLVCACAPKSDPQTSSEASVVPSFYRFVDEQARDPRQRDNRARAGVTHLKVLRPGFWRVQPPDPGEDPTVPLEDLIHIDALHPEATGIGIVARKGQSLLYTYVETGTRDTLAHHPIRVFAQGEPPEDSVDQSVYALELFPDSYVSRPVVVPQGARLEFAISVDHTFGKPRKDTVLFEIFLERGQQRETVFSEKIQSTHGTQDQRLPWKEQSIDLASYAGDTARFTFQTTIEMDENPKDRERIRTVPLWGNPILFAGAPEPRSDKPNLIVISLDTLRADHLGVYGYHKDTSPNIDRFAENAIVFEQCISPSSWTTPAHASLLSGLNPAVHGAGGYEKLRLRDSVVTLAELAQQKGYLTVALTDGGAVAGNTGLAQGFDRYFDNQPGASKVQGTSENQYYRALKWLNTYKDHPFFMFFHTYETHAPYDPPSPFLERFKTGRRDYAKGLSPNREHALENIGLYDGSIAYTDSVMGQFFDWLEKQGLMENTAILLLSDHGDEFWDHGSIRHLSTLYEELVHVPFILRLPGTSPPKGRVERMISLTDTFATALDILDIAYEAPLDSMSVLPLFNGGGGAAKYTRQSVEGFVYSDRLDRLTIAHRTQKAKYIATAELLVEDSPISAHISSGVPSGNLVLGRALLDTLFDPQVAPGSAEELYDLSVDTKELSNLSINDALETDKKREAFRAVLEKFAAEASVYNFDGESRLGPTAEELAELEALGYLN